MLIEVVSRCIFRTHQLSLFSKNSAVLFPVSRASHSATVHLALPLEVKLILYRRILGGVLSWLKGSGKNLPFVAGLLEAFELTTDYYSWHGTCSKRDPVVLQKVQDNFLSKSFRPEGIRRSLWRSHECGLR